MVVYIVLLTSYIYIYIWYYDYVYCISCLLSFFKHVHSPGLSFISKLYNQSHITRLIARESMWFKYITFCWSPRCTLQDSDSNSWHNCCKRWHLGVNMGCLRALLKKCPTFLPSDFNFSLCRTEKLPSEKLASKKAPPRRRTQPEQMQFQKQMWYQHCRMKIKHRFFCLKCHTFFSFPDLWLSTSNKFGSKALDAVLRLSRIHTTRCLAIFVPFRLKLQTKSQTYWTIWNTRMFQALTIKPNWHTQNHLPGKVL